MAFCTCGRGHAAVSGLAGGACGVEHMRERRPSDECGPSAARGWESRGTTPTKSKGDFCSVPIDPG